MSVRACMHVVTVGRVGNAVGHCRERREAVRVKRNSGRGTKGEEKRGWTGTENAEGRRGPIVERRNGRKIDG